MKDLSNPTNKGASKIAAIKLRNHKSCSLQYLGRDFSLGIARKAYFCINHNEAFTRVIPPKSPTDVKA